MHIAFVLDNEGCLRAVQRTDESEGCHGVLVPVLVRIRYVEEGTRAWNHTKGILLYYVGNDVALWVYFLLIK